VYVSAEVITTISGVAGVLLAMASGFGWMIRRMDGRFDSLETRLTARIDGVADELVEVKIAIARLEGPQPRLLAPR